MTALLPVSGHASHQIAGAGQTNLDAFAISLTVLGSMAALFASMPNPKRSNHSLGGSSPHAGTAGLAGLGLSYALPIVSSLQGLIGSFSETEKEFVSVERQAEYIGLDPEDEHIARDVGMASSASNMDQGASPAQAWPARGRVQFSDVTARYPRTGRSALSGIHLTIEAGQSLGICGRTGSGKTSLVSIDGENLSSLPIP